MTKRSLDVECLGVVRKVVKEYPSLIFYCDIDSRALYNFHHPDVGRIILNDFLDKGQGITWQCSNFFLETGLFLQSNPVPKTCEDYHCIPGREDKFASYQIQNGLSKHLIPLSRFVSLWKAKPWGTKKVVEPSEHQIVFHLDVVIGHIKLLLRRCSKSLSSSVRDMILDYFDPWLGLLSNSHVSPHMDRYPEAYRWFFIPPVIDFNYEAMLE